jgi:hypothetical protein
MKINTIVIRIRSMSVEQQYVVRISMGRRRSGIRLDSAGR